ncbi:MAG: hypothetical protein ACFFA0_15195 [Promethearchaeota archaeon]
MNKIFLSHLSRDYSDVENTQMIRQQLSKDTASFQVFEILNDLRHYQLLDREAVGFAVDYCEDYAGKVFSDRKSRTSSGYFLFFFIYITLFLNIFGVEIKDSFHMRYKDLVKLVLNIIKDKDNLSKGSIGFNGYGFVFRDIKDISLNFNPNYSSQICSVGTVRKFLCDLNQDSDSNIFYRHYDMSSDLIYISAIKTLVPSLKSGTNDLLFEVWMLVKTPEKRIFPAIFYYGRSRLAIGGWNLDIIKSLDDEFDFPNDLKKFINFNPFNLNEKEKNSLGIALESALHKIPFSNFDAKFSDDYGEYFLSFNEGVPIFRRIEEDENWPIEIISNGSWCYLDKFERLIKDHLTQEENYRIKQGLNLKEFKILRKNLIERCYEDLFELACNQNSRFAFQVLGSLFMEYNVKFTDDVKRLILQNSQWKDERHKLKNKDDKIKRKKYLLEFRKKILVY